MIGYNKLRELYNYFFDKFIWYRKNTKTKKIIFGKGVYFNRKSLITAKKVIIGDYSWINNPIKIRGTNIHTIKIGRFCAFGYNRDLICTNHKTYHANLQMAIQIKCGFNSIVDDLGAILIANNVWIWDNVTILPGVKIGDGVVIGASSVVSRNIPPFPIAVGVPAKIIKKRFSEEIINELLRIKWWNWDLNKIKRNKEFFEADLNLVEFNTLRSMIK